MNVGDWKLGPMIAYEGKADCTDPRCRRMVSPDQPHVSAGCLGWHCAFCDQPCSSQGHDCEQRRLAEEQP